MSDHSYMRALASGGDESRVARVVKQAAPGAGVETIVTVPGQEVWRIIAITATLTTSAVVANRLPSLVIDDGSDTLVRIAANAAQAASLAVVYSFVGEYPSVVGTPALGFVTVPVPSLVVPAGHRIRTLTTLLDAGDAWSSVVVWVDAMLTQPNGVRQYREAVEESTLVSQSPFLGGQ